MSAASRDVLPGAEPFAFGQTRGLAARQSIARLFNAVFLVATCLAIVALAVLLWTIVGRG